MRLRLVCLFLGLLMDPMHLNAAALEVLKENVFLAEFREAVRVTPLLDGISLTGEAVGPVTLDHIKALAAAEPACSIDPCEVSARLIELLSKKGISSYNCWGAPIYSSVSEAIGMFNQISGLSHRGNSSGIKAVHDLMASDLFLGVGKSALDLEKQTERAAIWAILAELRAGYVSGAIAKKLYEARLAAIEENMKERLAAAKTGSRR